MNCIISTLKVCSPNSCIVINNSELLLFIYNSMTLSQTKICMYTYMCTQYIQSTLLLPLNWFVWLIILLQKCASCGGFNANASKRYKGCGAEIKIKAFDWEKLKNRKKVHPTQQHKILEYRVRIQNEASRNCIILLE